MVSDDLMMAIQRLPLDEKVALLEALIRTVNEELHHSSSETAATPDAKRLADLLDDERQPPPFEELRGVLTGDTPIATEYDWKDDYAGYLTKKYA